MNKCLSIPDKELTTDKRADATKVQPDKPMSFIGIAVEGLLVGTELTQRQSQHQKPSPTWVTAHKGWKPGENCATNEPTCLHLILESHLTVKIN